MCLKAALATTRVAFLFFSNSYKVFFKIMNYGFLNFKLCPSIDSYQAQGDN